RLLLGDEKMERIEEARVILFGVGGVCSWCAESLVRSGILNLTIVYNDEVSPSNINRQLMATTLTIGKPKVEALAAHLLTINPQAEITTRSEVYCADTAKDFDLPAYDIIIDCIDSLSDKALLIENATRTKAKFFSSMGAALKLDPTRIKVAEFRQVKGCPLARALRQRFKKAGRFPSRKFKCVYSDELLTNQPLKTPHNDNAQLEAYGSTRKASINGSIHHITAIFGLTLAGLALESI
ncbi:MAG: tRNA threonylcarbamoyladenosine dehydratase, partial [Muribaculaceae bacterium]|nr:tRNA threonylcarbamoyladenosine dehydratase [Muribaculaceae bacterium]